MNCSKCKGLGRIYMGCDSWVHCDACNTTGKREWQGLSWEEIDECFKITPDQYLPAQIYKRIEAKLKEKNHDQR